MTTAWQLEDCLTNAWRLPDNFLTTTQQPPCTTLSTATPKRGQDKCRTNVICRSWATPNLKSRFTYLKNYATFPKQFVQKTDLLKPELKLNSSLKSQYTRSYKLDKAILKIWLVQNLSNQPVQWRTRLKSLSNYFLLHWPKGQKISKAIYGVLNSSKKRLYLKP